MTENDYAELAHAYGKPQCTATYKAEAGDFRVSEELGFEPDGQGEHLFLLIEKAGLNTREVQQKLMRFFHRPAMDVCFSGMKDKRAITQQWFSVRLPENSREIASLNSPHLTVLKSVRNSRKLKRGSHKRNHFRLCLRDIKGDSADCLERLDQVSASGFPNYFGEQRFGQRENNVDLARKMFRGALPGAQEKRSIYLSAARAALFNRVLSRRVELANWDTYLDGDVMMLDGATTGFVPGKWDSVLQERLLQHDIHPSGPLWGESGNRGGGRLEPQGACAELESALLDEDEELAKGLAASGLKKDRRALRVVPGDLEYQMEDGSSLQLSFSLPRGAYATALLRELVSLRPLEQMH